MWCVVVGVAVAVAGGAVGIVVVVGGGVAVGVVVAVAVPVVAVVVVGVVVAGVAVVVVGVIGVGLCLYCCCHCVRDESVLWLSPLAVSPLLRCCRWCR